MAPSNTSQPRTVPARTVMVRVQGSKQPVAVQMDEKPIARGKYQTAIFDALLAGRAIDGFGQEFTALRPQRMSVAAGMFQAVLRNMRDAGYTIEDIQNPDYAADFIRLYRIKP